jgi:pimeloyl-ACP methyl ester carboxylesterase
LSAVRALPAALLVALLAGCAPRIALPGADAVTIFDRDIPINGAPLTIHLARPSSPDLGPLLLYATGDGGWRGKDRDLFRMLVATRRSVAGISAPQYLKHLNGESGTTTPRRLGRDYETIIAFARRALDVAPDRPVLLVGVSRGAGLAVVAAGQPGVQRQLAGVLAIALTREEEYVRWFGRLRAPRAGRRRVMLQVYEYLPLLGQVPVAVVQSTHDNYLPAADAQQLFGAETPWRMFRSIESRNHSFSDRRAAMYAAARSSLDWIEHAGDRQQR